MDANRHNPSTMQIYEKKSIRTFFSYFLHILYALFYFCSSTFFAATIRAAAATTIRMFLPATRSARSYIVPISFLYRSYIKI